MGAMQNMDEQNNLIARERATGGNPLETLPARSPFLTLDMMPREPHLHRAGDALARAGHVASASR